MFIMKNNPEIDFYKNDAVHTVLKRYDFSESEKKIIYAAIVTAKKEKPNMTLIEKSDALLKMVATSRDTIDTEKVDELETKKYISAAEMANYKHVETSSKKKPLDRSALYLYTLVIWLGAIITFNYFLGDASIATRPLANGAEGHLKLYTFENAQKLCSQNNKVLPLTIDDAIEFLGTPDIINAQGFWSADQKVIYNIAQGYKDNDKQKHYVVCVDKNGKGIVKY